MVDSEISLTLGNSRSIIVHRTEKGFGFTLRHFVVYSDLESGKGTSTSGQDGSAANSEMMDTIFVKQVTNGGPAYVAGLRKGDRILAVNGQCVTGKSYSQVVALMQASDQSLKLVVEPKEGDVLQSKYETSAYASGDAPYSGKAGDIPSPPSLAWRASEPLHSRPDVPQQDPSSAPPADSESCQPKPTHKSFEAKNLSLDSSLEMHLARPSPPPPPGKGTPPPVQSRTSSRNVLLRYPLAYPRPYMDMGGQRAGSLDSICSSLTTGTENPNHPNTDASPRQQHHDQGRQKRLSEVVDRSEVDRKRFSTSEQRKRFFECRPANSIHLPDSVCGQEEMEVRSLPADTRSFSTEGRSLPTDTRTLPNEGRSLPADTRTLTPELRQVPSNTSGKRSQVPTDGSSVSVDAQVPSFTGSHRHSSADSPVFTGVKAVKQEKSVKPHMFSVGQEKAATAASQEMSKQDTQDYGIAVSLNHINFLQDVNSQKTVPKPYASHTLKPAKQQVSDDLEFVSKQKRKLSLGEQASPDFHSSRNSGRNKTFGKGEGKDMFSDHRSSWSSVSTTSSSLQHSLPTQDLNRKLALSSDPIPHYSPTATGGRPKLIHNVLSQDEVDAKLARRTSYLMATRQRSSGEPENNSTEPQPAESPQDSSAKGNRQQKNIKKLKAFFGEKTPKIVEAQKTGDEPSSPLGDVVMEGQLSCKLAMTDGKKASDRSWKPMWALLRGHVLLLYKDKNSVNPLVFEEAPISIKSSFTDIAYDYTKKKHVFRLTTYNGSEYLFQAEEHRTMLQWIRVMQENSNPDRDKSGVSKEELINRKIAQLSTQEKSPAGQTQNQLKVKQKSSRALRAKSPAASAYSPALKQKRQPYKDDIQESPKSSKTWKGKMVRRFRRSGSSSTSTLGEGGEMAAQVTFGMPLEYCPPATFSEYVPFVVEVCTKMVEARGLETQGIYRVPGNNGSVNFMQTEIDKGPDLVDMDNEKWLDVYVVGSLLKAFFRKLPEPLITEELYDSIIQANRTDVQEKRMLKLKKVIHGLPEHNFETFHYLAQHLHRVIEKEAENKMDARNIAIVFGPTLIRTVDDSMVTMVRDMSDQCRIIESIVSHPDWFFGSWDEDVYVPVDSEEPGVVPISGMNQTLINRAENMQLGERGKEFSAKDLMSSVFSAANKKVRRRDKYKTESIDAELESDVSYNERNIDAEIEIRGRRVAEKMAEVCSPQPPPVPPHSQPITATAAKPRQSADQRTEGSGQRSDASRIGDRTDSRPEPESSSNQNLEEGGQAKQEAGSRGDQKERLQRDLHTAKLAFMQQTPQPVSLGPQHMEPRYPGPRQQEQRHRPQTEQRDLQLEVKRYPAYTAPDFRSFSTETSKPVIHYKYHTGQREITPPPRSLNVSRGNLSTNQNAGGGSYRVGQEQERERRKRQQAKQKIEMELQKTKRELEEDEDGAEGMALYSMQYTGRPHSHHHHTDNQVTRHKSVSAHMQSSVSCGALKPPGGVSSSRGCYDDLDVRGGAQGEGRVRSHRSPHRPQPDRGSRHIGSLDSLLDHHERAKQYDSDSSDQDDFLLKLTSTFDSKLRSLGDQYGGSSSSGSSRSGQVILAQGNKHHLVPSSFVDKFRDPSLHRVTPPKGDPNIGIACRFERRDIDSLHGNSSGNGSNSSNRHTGGTGAEATDSTSGGGGPLSESQAYYVLSGPNPTVSLKSQGIMDSLKSGAPESLKSQVFMDSLKSGPPESLKSQGFIDSLKSQAIDSRKQEVDRLSSVATDDSVLSGYSGKQVPSPPASPQRSKRARRRHTVGGTHDTEHYEALLALTQQPPLQLQQPLRASGTAASAWERLQPATQNTEPRDMQSWLKQQRLKNVKSTPSLLIATNTDQAFDFYRFDDAFSPRQNKRQRQSQRDSLHREADLPSPLSPPSLQLSRPFTFESSI